MRTQTYWTIIFPIFHKRPRDTSIGLLYCYFFEYMWTFSSFIGTQYFCKCNEFFPKFCHTVQMVDIHYQYLCHMLHLDCKHLKYIHKMLQNVFHFHTCGQKMSHPKIVILNSNTHEKICFLQPSHIVYQYSWKHDVASKAFLTFDKY